MRSIGFPELLVILGVAVLLFGGKKIPEVAKGLGEGIRNMDIMRLNAPIPGKGSVPTIDPSNTAYVWPIPSTELATNKLMTRN